MHIKIKRNNNEVNEVYKRRKWFIELFNPKNSHEYEEAVLLSNIWVNIIILKCKYKKDVMVMIENIIKNKIYNNKIAKKNNKKI